LTLSHQPCLLDACSHQFAAKSGRAGPGYTTAHLGRLEPFWVASDCFRCCTDAAAGESVPASNSAVRGRYCMDCDSQHIHHWSYCALEISAMQPRRHCASLGTTQRNCSGTEGVRWSLVRVRRKVVRAGSRDVQYRRQVRRPVPLMMYPYPEVVSNYHQGRHLQRSLLAYLYNETKHHKLTTIKS
jgi:hypothetical protein